MYIQLLEIHNLCESRGTDLKIGTPDKQFLLKMTKPVIWNSAIKIIQNLRITKLVSNQKPFGAAVLFKSKRLDRFVF